MNTDFRSVLRHADTELTPVFNVRHFALRLCCGLSILSAGASFSTEAMGRIVGAAGVGGVGGNPNGGIGGVGGEGGAALDITTSYTTVDDVEGGVGGGGGGGGGGGLDHVGGGAGGTGGRGGHGVVISGGDVVLHNDGWSISGGLGGGGGGGGGGGFNALATANGGRGGDGGSDGAGGGGGGGADSFANGAGFGGDGGNAGADGLHGDANTGFSLYAGAGGGGGGTPTNGGSGGSGAYGSTSPGVGGVGGIAGGAPTIDGGPSGAPGYAGGGGGGAAPGGVGGMGGLYGGMSAGRAPGGAVGVGGFGVYVTGANSLILNNGHISGGPGQDTAIKYAATARDSTLVLQEGSEIVGLVDATESDGRNTLVLDGGSALAFDVSKIGVGPSAQYLGFNAFEKTSPGTWRLTGAPAQTFTPWTLSGGWLALTDDANLDGGGTLTFNGGGLQLDEVVSIHTHRDLHFAADGIINTSTSGTRFSTAGTISGAGDLIKTGAGTMIIAGDNVSSGMTRVEDGTLQIGNWQTAGSLGAGAVVNNGILIFSRADNVTVSNAISGTGRLIRTGAGTLTLTGPLTYTGDTYIYGGRLVIDNTTLGRADHAPVRVYGIGPSRTNYLGLTGGAVLNGSIFGNHVSIDASSQWNIFDRVSGTYPSGVDDIQLAGIIRFAPRAGGPYDAVARTFRAENLIGAGGEVQLHMSTAGTVDYVTLNEGATGLTNLSIVSAKGFGDALPGNGLLVVQAGASTDNAFQRTPGQPMRGGAFSYALFHGARDDAPDLANNWYLRSELRPQVSLYSQLGNQSLRQSELSVGTFNERMGSTESLARKVYPYVWGRTLGALENREGAPRGISQSHVAADSSLGGLQLGTDLFVVNKGISRKSVGVYASALVSRNDVDHYRESTRSNVRAGRSDQTTYGLGAYYTVIDGKGGYADFVTQFSRYGVKTESNGMDGVGDVTMRTSGWGGALSAEVGKAYALGSDIDGFRIEPQAQLMYQHVKLRDGDDGISRVSLPAVHALHSRVSLKVSKAWGEQTAAVSNGWLMLSLQHTMGESSSAYPTLTQGDVAFDNKLDGARVGLKAGYDRTVGKNTFINVQLNAERGLGSTSALQALGGSVGIKYLF